MKSIVDISSELSFGFTYILLSIFCLLTFLYKCIYIVVIENYSESEDNQKVHASRELFWGCVFCLLDY